MALAGIVLRSRLTSSLRISLPMKLTRTPNCAPSSRSSVTLYCSTSGLCRFRSTAFTPKKLRGLTVPVVKPCARTGWL